MKKLSISFFIISLLYGISILAFAQSTIRSEIVKVKFPGEMKDETLYKNSYALIIGVTDYTEGWNDLPGAAEDVTEIQESLKKHNFQTTVFLNYKSKETLDGIKQFIDDYGYEYENRLLIYFAGHGHTQKLPDGRELGYIIPSDTPLSNKDNIGFLRKAISMDTIQFLAKQAQSKHVLFVFDSCFSGKLISRDNTRVPAFIRENVATPVRQFITSGAANQTVPDQSLFRIFFVRALDGEADRNQDGYILGSELADYLKENVTNYSEGGQTPQYGKIRDVDLDRGDFVFVLPKIAKSGIKFLPQEPRPKVSIDFWEEQRTKAFNWRSSEISDDNEETIDEDLIGDKPRGLIVPKELIPDGISKQKAKIRELTLKLPKDYAELANMYFQRELIDLPIATENYFLDVGSSVTGKSFTSFDFTSGSVKLSETSEKYQILENLANNFSGEKYDLKRESDRKELRIHLLQMLSPRAKLILEQIAFTYRKKFNRPLQITSMARSMDFQIEVSQIYPNTSFIVRDEDSLPPHVSGFAFDISRKYLTAKEQNFVLRELAELEREGKIDALIEYGANACFHIFVYPDGKPPRIEEKVKK